MTSERPRSTGCLGCAAVSLLLAVPFVAIGLGMFIEGIPGHYEETVGIVVIGDDAIIRFEDVAGNEILFDAFGSAEEGESFTVYYDPADPSETAFTPQGRSEETFVDFIIAAFLVAVAAGLAGVAAWRFYRHRPDADA